MPDQGIIVSSVEAATGGDRDLRKDVISVLAHMGQRLEAADTDARIDAVIDEARGKLSCIVRKTEALEPLLEAYKEERQGQVPFYRVLRFALEQAERAQCSADLRGCIQMAQRMIVESYEGPTDLMCDSLAEQIMMKGEGMGIVRKNGSYWEDYKHED